MATNDKLAAAAHLVIAALPPTELGATKLNKILWFADCEFYRRHGRSLTGETHYVRRDFGPCPNGMNRSLTTLKDAGAIAEQTRYVGSFPQRAFLSLQEPAIGAFDAEEIHVLLSEAVKIAPLTAAEASAASHDDLWEAGEDGDLMSVEAGSVRVFAPPPEVVSISFSGRLFGRSWTIS